MNSRRSLKMVRSKEDVEKLAGELGAGTPLKGAWLDFLSKFNDHYPSPGWEEKVIPLLLPIVSELGVLTTHERLSRLLQEEGYPPQEINRLLIVVVDQLQREQAARLRELKRALAELATPVIRIWTDVLLVPLIGGLDAERAEAMAEKLLETVSTTRARTVIVDVTGLPMIDTAVGSFLIETFTATKLLGTDVILTGIKPHVAHTLAKLGIDFRMVTISRDLEDALRRAIRTQESEGEQKKHLFGIWAAGEKAYESGT